MRESFFTAQEIIGLKSLSKTNVQIDLQKVELEDFTSMTTVSKKVSETWSDLSSEDNWLQKLLSKPCEMEQDRPTE